MKLTAKGVEGLKPRASEFVVWDDDVPGFGARVSPSGGIRFTLKYVHHGRQRRMSLGRYGDITAQQARAKAVAARGQLADGVDPQLGRDADRAMLSLDDAWARFTEVKGSRWKPETCRGYARTYKRILRPKLGNRAVGDISRADVTSLHYGLRATPRTANLVIAMLSSFIGFARKQGFYPGDNPCTVVERYEERPRERVLNDDELARLGSALAAAGDDFGLAAIRLIVLTGARKGEILHMQWSQVDLDAINPHARLSVSKTGPRTLQLPPAAVAILRTLPRVSDNPYCIPGEKLGAPRYDLKKPWAKICKAAGIEGATIHDLRRTFGSRAVSNGVDILRVSRALGHTTVAQTEAAYAFLSQDATAQAARAIGNGIADVMASRVNNVLKIGGDR